MRNFLLLALLAGVGLLASGQTQYFQQTVDHTIEVTLDDEAHVLHGGIRTRYVNNSPDTLGHLWIHVWPNAYADGTTALAKQQVRQNNMILFWAMARDRGGIDSLAFTVNDRPADWTFHPEHIDIVRLELADPLLPGEELTYATPFRVKLPSGQISRLGHIGQTYQITQWYPKPAVYDAQGWHEMPYLNQGEFYSEYGSFDVTVNLPASYTVGATGDFVPGYGDNDRELERLDALDAWTRQQLETPDPRTTQPGADLAGMKSLRYRQSNVHDFAWFADKNWWVLKDSVQLEGSGRTVTTWAMFTPDEAEWWRKAPEYINDATRLYSRWVGEYPYNQVTAVDGTISAGGGMEYPNVTVIGRTRSDSGLETVIVHEVGHNWFYGLLGSNERTNAWMDEGINSYYETRYFEHKYPDLQLTGRTLSPIAQKMDLAGLRYGVRDNLAYLLTAQMGIDQPLQCHSNDFADLNYGTIVYKKSAAAFRWLQAHLDDARFDDAMQTYFARWHFKHPQPEDLRSVMEEVTYEPLNWFFEDVVQTTGQYDMALRGARVVDGGLKVRLRNAGEIEAPTALFAQLEGDDAEWKLIANLPPVEQKMASSTFVELPAGMDGADIRSLRLDADRTSLEVRRTNDTRRTSGVLRGMEPLRFRLGTRLETPEATQIFWLPALAGNQYDGFMAGVALHNSTVPLRNSEWLVVPMYGFKSKSLTGLARYSMRLGREWRVEASTQRFGETAEAEFMPDHKVWRNELRLEGRFNRQPASALQSGVDLSLIDIRELVTWPEDAIIPFVYYANPHRQAITLSAFAQMKEGLNSSRLDVRYRQGGQEFYDEFHLNSTTTGGLIADFTATDRQMSLAYQFRHQINADGASWGLRFFGGITKFNRFGFAPENLLPLSAGGIGAAEDVWMDGMFPNRSIASPSEGAGWLAVVQGGVYGVRESSSATVTGPDNSLLALRVDRSLPFLKSHFYAGIVRSRKLDMLSSTVEPFAWACGLLWPISEGRIEVALPLWASGWQSQAGYKPWESIAVVLNLRDLGLLKQARQVLASQR